jgi:hypothetical protein
MIAVRARVKYQRHTSKPGSNTDLIDEHGAGVRGTWKLPTYLYFQMKRIFVLGGTRERKIICTAPEVIFFTTIHHRLACVREGYAHISVAN